jgi:hypothetical protein
MRIPKSEMPVKVQAPGAVARQQTDFGDAQGYGMIGGEFFTMDAGADIAPLLEGLHDDVCHAPHWGYVLQGELTVSYKDGTHESVGGGDLFYWPPGHSVKVEKDAEFVMFSPQREHTDVLDHINRKIHQG